MWDKRSYIEISVKLIMTNGPQSLPYGRSGCWWGPIPDSASFCSKWGPDQTWKKVRIRVKKITYVINDVGGCYLKLKALVFIHRRYGTRHPASPSPYRKRRWGPPLHELHSRICTYPCLSSDKTSPSAGMAWRRIPEAVFMHRLQIGPLSVTLHLPEACLVRNNKLLKHV